MKKSIILLCSCAVMILLSQCAKKGVPTNKTAKAKHEAPVEKTAEMNIVYTPEQLAEGELIFKNNCGTCHKLRQPPEFTMKAWDRILPDMTAKAKLSHNDAGKVRGWIATKAKS